MDDVDIKTYNNDDWVPSSPLLASAFQIWLDNNNPSYGYANQTYQNIRIEGSAPGPLLSLKNTVYPFGGPNVFDPPLGNAYNIVFKNIALEGTQKYRSQILGWDANNGFHNIVLDNFRFNGVAVNQTNLGQYFDMPAGRVQLKLPVHAHGVPQFLRKHDPALRVDLDGAAQIVRVKQETFRRFRFGDEAEATTE